MRVGWKQTIEGTCTPFTHGGPLPPNSLQLPTLLEACAGRDTLFLFSHSLMMHQESLKLEIQFLVLKQWYTCWDSGFGRSQPQGSQGHMGRGQSPSIRQRERLEKKKNQRRWGEGQLLTGEHQGRRAHPGWAQVVFGKCQGSGAGISGHSCLLIKRHFHHHSTEQSRS